METFIQSLINGILTGSLYAMIGVGLTVIFGVMRIINLAHGDMVMLGMFSAYWSYTLWKIDSFVSAILWVPLFFVAGMLAYRYLIKAIMPGGELNTLRNTAGMSLLIANLALIVWKGDYRTLNLPYAVEPLHPFGIAVPVPLELAHHGYVLESGRVVLEGTGKELLANDRVREAYLGW